MAVGDSFGAFGAYMRTMTKSPALLALLLLATPALLFGSAGAQTLPDPAQQRYETQNAVNQQLLQQQQQNLQVQQSVQQNELRQQQLFNSMPPPAYQQQQPFVPRPATP